MQLSVQERMRLKGAAKRFQDAKLLETVYMHKLNKQDSPCSASAAVTKETCLSTPDAQCMWIATDSGNICMPCELAGKTDDMAATPLPCPAIGNVFAMKKVLACDMQCSHQSMITKDSPCVDVLSGTVSPDQCFSKGTSVLS